VSNKLLSPQEFRVWHAFKLMGEDVMERVGRDITEATGLSGPDFGVLSRVVDMGKGEMRQQRLAESMGWDKSRLSHHLTRMQRRHLIDRVEAEKRVVLVVITKVGRAKLDAARPVHAESIRRNLLSRLSAQQIEMIVRVSNLLGDEGWESPDRGFESVS
jgi:DNA-binding MarR family transcriptional regulator